MVFVFEKALALKVAVGSHDSWFKASMRVTSSVHLVMSFSYCLMRKFRPNAEGTMERSFTVC
jgi:hypothetical protein